MRLSDFEDPAKFQCMGEITKTDFHPILRGRRYIDIRTKQAYEVFPKQRRYAQADGNGRFPGNLKDYSLLD